MQFDLKRRTLELQLNKEEINICHKYISEVLFHVDRGCLDYIKLITEAINNNSKLFYYEYSMSKDEIEYIQNTVIQDLLIKLSLNRKCDYYFRKISALKLLGIKNDDLPTHDNYSYWLARRLSNFENGDSNRKKILTTLVWLISEYTKDPIRSSIM